MLLALVYEEERELALVYELPATGPKTEELLLYIIVGVHFDYGSAE
jgi:hypothetical protein